MEDLIGVVIFLVFVLGSWIARAAKSQQNNQEGQQQPQAPKWPGPVATPPGGFPRPAQPAPPSWSKLPRQEKPAASARPTGEGVGTEGVGTEGIGTEGLSSLEGPTANESVAYEMDRFQRESVAMEGRHLERFRTDLEVSEEAAQPVSEGQARLDLSRDRLAEAVVWSEILARPKALRARR